MVPKGSTHEHWKRVHLGAEKAAAEYRKGGISVTVLWKSPLREDDREQQVEVVEGFISQGVSGLVLAPLDSSALMRPVEEAASAGIPTVIFDSALADPTKTVSYVSTDNGRGGHLAAKRMGEVLKGRGTVLMLRYQEGSAATEEREQGFLDELKASFPGITVTSSDQFAGRDARHGKAHLGKSAQSLRRSRRRDLYAERIVDCGNAAGAAGHRQGRQGHVCRLRLQRRLSSRRSNVASWPDSSCRTPSTWAI